MAWTEFTDEKVGPFETKRVCKRCLQQIAPGSTLVKRRGREDGRKNTSTFHEDCRPPPDDPAPEPAADDEPDSVTLPPDTTPLATVADEEAAAAKKADDD